MRALSQQTVDEGSRALRPAAPARSSRLGAEARRSGAQPDSVPDRGEEEGTFWAEMGRSRQIQQCRLTTEIQRTAPSFVRSCKPNGRWLRWDSIAGCGAVADFSARSAAAKRLDPGMVVAEYHQYHYDEQDGGSRSCMLLA